MIGTQELNLEPGGDSLPLGVTVRVIVHSVHISDDHLAVPSRTIPAEPFLYLAAPPLPKLDDLSAIGLPEPSEQEADEILQRAVEQG